MQSRNWKWYICFALITLAAIGASIWTYVDMIGLCINIGSVVVMVSIIIWALGVLDHKKCVGLVHLAEAAADLRTAAGKITEQAQEPDTNVEEEYLFSHQLLRQAYAAHRRELDRLDREGSSFRFSDIAEYVNQELLDHIGNMSFCDIVGGSMTGLGILGTFLGLMIGLQDFDPSSADAMLQTIPTLIDGIKIAFLTSIFGVIYSLLFNMYCRGVQEDASATLEEFLSTYYKYVIPQPENDGFTRLIQYQQSQTDSMARFAGELAVAMANSLKENVAPTFERIEASISGLTERLAKSQSETMDEVASRFVENMDKSMGDQLSHLGENIRKLCQWQDETMDKMEQTIQAFSEAGDKVGAVNAKLDASFDALEQYLQNMAKLQGQVNEDFGTVLMALDQAAQKLEQQNEAASEQIAAQKELIRNMNDASAGAFERAKEYQEAVIDVQKEIAAYASAMKDSAEQIRAEITATSDAAQAGMSSAVQATVCAMDQAIQAELQQMQANMASIEKTQRAFIDGMDKSSEHLTRSAAQMSAASQDLTNNLDRAMSRTYQEIDRQMAEIVRHLSGTIADIRDVTEQLPKLLTAAASQTQKTTEQYLSTISESQKQLAAEVKRHNRADHHRGEN